MDRNKECSHGSEAVSLAGARRWCEALNIMRRQAGGDQRCTALLAFEKIPRESEYTIQDRPHSIMPR